jgi:hypothetical protein
MERSVAERVADSSRQYEGAAIPHSIIAKVTAGGTASVQSGPRRAGSGHGQRVCVAAASAHLPRSTSVSCPAAMIPLCSSARISVLYDQAGLPFLNRKKGVINYGFG